MMNNWKISNLGEIADIKRGLPSQDLNYVDSIEEGVRLIRINDFKSDNPKYIKETDKTQKLTIKKGDVIIAGTGATAGISFLVDELWDGLPFSYNAPRIRVKKGNSSQFVYYILNSEKIKKQQNRLFTGNAQPFLDTRAIASFKIPVPPLPEQQKIADILSTVDAKIDVIDQQITETQSLKKGLMQRLLTKGIGHTEFKDSPLGKIPKSWEVVRFDEVCFNSSVKYNKPNGKCVELEHIEQQTSRLIGYGEIQDKTSVKSAFSIGDVLFCKLRPYLRKYWKCEFEGGCTSELMVLKPRNNFITDYLFYIIQQDSFIENSVSKSYGTKMPRTSWKILSEYTLGLPSIEEQTRISMVFKTFDEKLEVLSEKKTHYQELKQGLMQQLLTGKIRVKTGVAV